MIILVVLLAFLAFLVVFVARQARVVLRNGIGLEARRSGRVFAAVLLGLVVGGVSLLSLSSDRTKGRVAYLEREAYRFDTFVSKPHSIPAAVIAGVLTTGMAVGAYELLAWGMALAIGSTKRSTPV
jgi:hypothetical protein